jgi:hypothetical protein
MSREQNHRMLKQGRGQKAGLRSLSIIPCYLALLHCQTSSAFSPVGESSLINKNKKCQGPSCPRRSTRSNSPRVGNIRGIRGDNPDKDHDNFAVRMAKYHNDQQKQAVEEEENTLSENMSSSESTTQERRVFIAGLFASTAAYGMLNPQPANAFEKAYPVNLDFQNDDSTINLESIRQARIAVQKSQAKQTKSELLTQPLLVRKKEDAIASVVWAGALWLLSGSRSNPLVKPLANILYDENTEEGAWVKDRNEGLFAPFPVVFTLVMGVVFCILGFVTDRGLLILSEGDSSVVLQLAGVSLIGGASLELGRIASGEKMITREDFMRDKMLADEFNEFAAKRLLVGQGGSIHRSEVITSFRRYFAKYRVENDQYPLTDLEIERLLRTWNKMEGNEEGISSAGFLKGVKINDQALIR